MKTPEINAQLLADLLASKPTGFYTSLETQLAAALREKDRRIERLEGYLERANWRRCDIAACNCNGYHNWNPSRAEIEEPLKERITELERSLPRSQSLVQCNACHRGYPPKIMPAGLCPDCAAKRIEELEKSLTDMIQPYRDQIAVLERRKNEARLKWFHEMPNQWTFDIRSTMGHCRRAAKLLKGKSVTKADQRCENCNAELSLCGPPGVDGEPSLDCKQCRLKERIAELEARIKELDPYGRGVVKQSSEF